VIRAFGEPPDTRAAPDATESEGTRPGMSKDSTPPPPAHHRSGHGHPVVLIHGLGGTWPIWRPVLRLIEEHCDVLAPTTAGHWGARWHGPVRSPMPEVMADEVEAWMDLAGFRQAHVVGHSLGSWVALELTRRGRALSTTVLCPSVAWQHARHRARLIAQLNTIFLAAHLTIPYAPFLMRWAPVRQTVFRSVVERVDTLSADDALEVLRGFVRADAYWPAMRGLVGSAGVRPVDGRAHDVHAAWALEDRMAPAAVYAKPLVGRVGVMTHSVIPRSGHLALWENPHAVAELILDRVGAVSRRPPPVRER